MKFKKKHTIDKTLKEYNRHIYYAEEAKKQQIEQKIIMDEAQELQKDYVKKQLAIKIKK